MARIEKEPLTDENDDRVRVYIDDEEVQIVERYAFHSSVFQQPSAFTFTLSGTRAQEARRRFRPGMACSLLIGKYPQFTGYIDAVNVEGDASRTSVEVVGRDSLARLHDQDISAERSFDNTSYHDLVKAALEDVELGGLLIDTSNNSNRIARAGAKLKARGRNANTDASKTIPVVTAKMGESWLTFLDRHLKKAGLFLWAGAAGHIILSRPDPEQDPVFRFSVTSKNEKRGTNVQRFALIDDTTGRFTQSIVFARSGGRKAGHNHTNGDFVDQEMKSLLGYSRRRVARDMNVNNADEAAYYARREIAEANRAGWKLQYIIAGHSAPTMTGVITGSGARAIVCPDMVASIDHDDLDIYDELYVASVEHRAPPRETVITFMRRQDIVFGDYQAEAGTKKAKQAVKQFDLASLKLGVHEPGLTVVSFSRTQNR